MKRTLRSLVVFTAVLTSLCFSQNITAPYNASYWNAYADKLQLKGADKQEFLSAHKKQNSQAPISLTIPSASQAPMAQKTFTQNNNTMAGPCVNADFEQGTLNGWVPTSGFNPGFNAVGCCTTAGGQQLIMSGAGTDPFGGFPVVFPGGNFSLRLGDPVNGGFADRIEQTFLVSPANANFSYKYAVVLEDPNHPISQQPSFQVEMVDSLNNQVPCTYFYVAAGQNIPGFFNSTTPGVIYKPWTTVLLDLTPYIGQNLTIRFTTFDCSLGGHFGYAYIDGVCQSFIGGGSATVCAGSTNTFCAPNGLASYMWNGPSTTSFVGQCLPCTVPGVYTVQTTLFSNCGGPSFTYTLDTQNSPTATAGPSQTVCGNNSLVSLSGSITGFTATPLWLTSGTGTFANATSLNTTYQPSAADIALGAVTLSLTTQNNGICPPGMDVVQVTILPTPTVMAGANQTICSTSSAALSATIIGATNTGSWTSGGTGTFSPSNTALTATYFPSPLDIANGSVVLQLFSTNNLQCFGTSGNTKIFFQNPPQANAGINPTVCANNSTVVLSGAILGYTNATPVWTSAGTGAFTSSTSLNTTYIPSAVDVANGGALITLSSVNNGVCPGSTSTVQVNITQAPIVSAGPSQTLCSIAAVSLNGNVSGPTTTGFWTANGSGTFNPSPNTPVTSYNFSPSDILAGSVVFTLTSLNNGNCVAATSTMGVVVKQLATVNAGITQAICANTSTIALSGTVTGVTTTGFWTSNGSGAYNPGAGFLNNTYFVTPSDVIAGSITFTLSSTNNGPCPTIADTVKIAIAKTAVVAAGANQLVCENQGSVALVGSVNSGTGTGVWSSSGTGIFSPSSSSLNTAYFFGSTDVINGSVIFTLSSTNNGPCPAVNDSVKVSIKRMAVVDAGATQSVCSTSGSVALSGSVTIGSTQGLWTSAGTGNFIPSPILLNTNYVYSNADLNAGSVTLYLSSLANGVCPSVKDSVTVLLFKDPIISLGNDTTICSYQNPVGVSAGISGYYGTLAWSGPAGANGFVPNAFLNPTKYKFGFIEQSAGFVTLTVSLTNNGPCANKSGTILVNIKPSPIANFAASSYTIFNPSDAIAFTNLSQQATTYIWDFGDGNQSNQIHPSHVYPGAGYYTAVLTASNQYGCTDTTEAQITVKSDIRFPNAFTPNTGGSNGGGYTNGDLTNDVFFPYTSTTGVKEFDMKIFNRYGELIFQTTDVKIGWDGYFNGKLCQQDAYVWKVKAVFFDDTKFEDVGSVTLLR